jgi:hypothetical protein
MGDCSTVFRLMSASGGIHMMLSPWDALDVRITVRVDSLKSMEEEMAPPWSLIYVEASLQKLLVVLFLFRGSMTEV